MKHLIYALILCTLICCSNNQETGENTDIVYCKGIIENGTYANDYFGFTLDIPSDWRVISADEYSERNMPIRQEVNIKVDDIKDRQEYFETLLVIEKDTTADTLYSFIVFMAEDRRKIKHSPKQYLEYSAKFINQDYPNEYPIYKFGPIKSQSTLGNKDFLAQPAFIWSSPDRKRNQITYCQEFGDHLLVVQLGGVSWKAEIKDAKKLLNSIKWKN